MGLVSSVAEHALAKGGKGGGQGAAAVATQTKGQTPGQLLAEAARDSRNASTLANISSGLKSQNAAAITSAKTVAGYIDMIAAAQSKNAMYNQTLAQQLLTAGTQRSPGKTKAQLQAEAKQATADSVTCGQAAGILFQVAGQQKGNGGPVGVFMSLANQARRMSGEFAHQAAEATREASRLK
jgi:hypothetical protein